MPTNIKKLSTFQFKKIFRRFSDNYMFENACLHELFFFTVPRDLRSVKGYYALFEILVDEKTYFVFLKLIAAYDSLTKLKD